MSDMDTVEAAKKTLMNAGYRLIEPAPPKPVRHCANCGVAEDKDNYGFPLLIDVRVEVHDGEEGWSDVTRFYCDECIGKVADTLSGLGLGSHHHGSTTFVEADTRACGGYGTCDLYGMAQEVYGDREIYFAANPADEERPEKRPASPA